MRYDFDQVIDRLGSGDVMHEALQSRWGRKDLLPMWVADMNFAVCPAIIDAMRKRLAHPIFGYTVLPDDYKPAIQDWIFSHHQWKVEKDWISFIPGIVKGLGMVLNVFTRPGDEVIIQPPVYHPFRLVPQGNGRKVVFNGLKRNPDGSYSMDFSHLQKVYNKRCKLFVLCNPHNPAGICWDRDTLIHLADFCYDHHLLVVSDEIHCDMALFGNKHIPFASVSEKAAANSITFQAPTKTFNIAGIITSHAIIPNPEIRRKFCHWVNVNELAEPHIFAPIATIAAFRHGEEWRKQMLAYVEDNIRFVEEYCDAHIPGIRPLRPQASFLIWLNCRGLGLSHEQLLDLFVDKAHLALNDGEMFGPGGEGFMRLNVGCPRSIIKKALNQLSQAVVDLPYSERVDKENR
jgi:cystathionine beta-lyase